MRNINRLIFIIQFLLFSNFYCTESLDILQIRKQFKLWQEKLNKKDYDYLEFYHVYSGENYENDVWLKSYEENKNEFLGEQVVFIKSEEVGNMFKFYQTSPSGDWMIYSEHYFWSTGELFFIFWSMNTSQADEHLTIERRLYFNKKGEKIRFLESAYKMNTKIKVDKPNYFNREVNYWLNIEKLPFYNLIDK